MLLATSVVFDREVPDLEAIAAAVNHRTGLSTTLRKHPKHDFIVVRCSEFQPMVEITIADRTVTIEQPGWYGVYFLDELVQALVDLGGAPHGNVSRRAPERWHDRPWRVRMIDAHPFIASMIWLGLSVRASERRRPK